MSDSTPASPARNATLNDQIVRLSPREWLLSVVGHGLVLALLIWLIPGQDLASLEKNPPDAAAHRPDQSALAAQTAQEQMMRDPHQLDEAVQKIEQEQSASAAERLAELLNTEKQMDPLVQQGVDTYKQQAKAVASTAPQTVMDLLQKIPAIQQTAAQDQTTLLTQVQALVANGDLTAVLAQKGTLEGSIHDLQNSIKKTQVTTEEMQTKATQLLGFVAPDYKESLDTQKKATATQSAATDAQQKAIDMQNELLSTLYHWNQLNATLADATKDVTNQQAAFDQFEQTTYNPAKAAVDAAKKHYDDMVEANKTQPVPAVNLANAKQQAEQAQRIFSSSTAISHDLGASRLKVARQGVADLTAAAGDSQKKATQLVQQLVDAQKGSQDAETAAIQQQTDAITQLAEAQKTAPATPTAVAVVMPALKTQEPDASTLNGKNLAELYQAARQTEDRMTEKYKMLSATDLASIQKLPLDEALKSTQIARPDRENLDLKLLAAQGAEKNFTAYKAEVVKANAQIDSMASLGESMLATAQARQDLTEGNIHLDGMTADAAYDNMVTAATADDTIVGKDLTGMTGDKAGSGNGGGQPAQGNNGGLAGGGIGAGSSQGASFGSQPGFSRGAPELPSMDYQNIKPWPTRKITANGPHYRDWLYVDSWYLIGPFPNPARKNLNTKFPPESVVDLDATYPGKDGNPIYWKFVQWPTPMLEIPNDIRDAPAIYYAYTELFFDQPMDLWITTGSDDKGTMWLNNVMVWNSNDNLKSWIPNEGYRKVHFVQGLNRVLYRLENAQSAAVLSLMISTKPASS